MVQQLTVLFGMLNCAFVAGLLGLVLASLQ